MRQTMMQATVRWTIASSGQPSDTSVHKYIAEQAHITRMTNSKRQMLWLRENAAHKACDNAVQDLGRLVAL